MKEKFLQKEQFPKFINELMNRYPVYAPIKKNGFHVFEKISSPKIIDLEYSNTKIPPKELFFPRAETLFSYAKSKEGIDLIQDSHPDETRVILGIRPCDVLSFLLLDKFFNNGKFQDPYYQKRRENSLIIGLLCADPQSTCFCTSTGGSPFSEAGMDISLTDLEDKYLVKSLNIKGDQLLEQIPWLGTASERDIFEATRRAKKALASIKTEIPIEKLSDKLEKLFNNDAFWSPFSQKCINCGSCSFLCPTCHCFDVVDEKTSTGGKRIRLWDTCQFTLFTQHGSGHNPRPTGKERIRQRIMHKFCYYPKTLNEIGCVGCGRCIRVCSVNQDIRSIFKAVQEVEGG